MLTDLNGDGELDLLVSEFISYNSTDGLAGGVAALGNGAGAFTATANFEGGDSSSVILQGDFLKDSASDALFVSGGSGTTVIISRGGAIVSVQASSPTIFTGNPVTINVTVTTTIIGRPQPTGIVTLTEAGSTIGSAGLNGGAASIVVSGLAVGSYQLTALYADDSNFNINSTSSTTVQVLPAPSVAISASPQALTLTQGQTGAITLTALANPSFSGNVTFSVSGAPNGMTVLSNPSSVTLTENQSASTSLVVRVTSPAQSALAWPFTPFTMGGGLGLAGIVLLPRRVAANRGRRRFALAAMLAGVLIGTLTMTACGSNGGSSRGPKGSTTLTVTATPSVSQAPVQTMKVIVIVD